MPSLQLSRAFCIYVLSLHLRSWLQPSQPPRFLAQGISTMGDIIKALVNNLKSEATIVSKAPSSCHPLWYLIGQHSSGLDHKTGSHRSCRTTTSTGIHIHLYHCERLITLTTGDGLLSSIFSIFSIISSVSRGRTPNAFKFSVTCSGLVAPRMTVEVFGFFATQARASAAGVV